MLSAPNTIVVMPAFNEAANIGDAIDSIIASSDLPVIVIADACTDDTVSIARKCNATVLPLSSQLGAWGATQTGIRYALQHGYDVVITMDADGQHHAENIPTLLETMRREKADLVIGSCVARGSHSRRIAWFLLRTLSGLTVRDLTSGFRAYSRNSMRVLAQAGATTLDYQDVGVLCLLRQAGLSIVETKVSMCARRDGKSRIFNSWFSVFRYMLYSCILSLSHVRLAVSK